MTDHFVVSFFFKYRHSKGRDQTSLDVQDVDWFIVFREQLDVILFINGELEWVPERQDLGTVGHNISLFESAQHQ